MTLPSLRSGTHRVRNIAILAVAPVVLAGALLTTAGLASAATRIGGDGSASAATRIGGDGSASAASRIGTAGNPYAATCYVKGVVKVHFEMRPQTTSSSDVGRAVANSSNSWVAVTLTNGYYDHCDSQVAGVHIVKSFW